MMVLDLVSSGILNCIRLILTKAQFGIATSKSITLGEFYPAVHMRLNIGKELGPECIVSWLKLTGGALVLSKCTLIYLYTMHV